MYPQAYTAVLVDVDSDGDVRGEVILGTATEVSECVRMLARYGAVRGIVHGLGDVYHFDHSGVQ